MRGRLKRRDTLGADGMDGLAQLLDALGEPGQLLDRDLVVARVARLHIGVLELLERGAVLAAVHRPDEQVAVKPLGMGAQERDVVAVGRVEGADEQRAMVEPFDRLMQVERRVL